jgi:hypothetical protein
MLTPNDLLENLRDSVKNAALRYADGDIVMIFATQRQVQAINIALGKLVPETIKDRALRITLLADIAGRSTRTFRSSKDLTLSEASALIDRLYDTETRAQHTWAEKRPEDGERIEAWSEPIQEWMQGTYFADGIDGLIEWPDASLCEIEEYGAEEIPKWRTIEMHGLADAALRPETASAIQCAYATLKEEHASPA